MQACIGLGANLGDAGATVQAALHALDELPRTRLLRASRLYRTPAWGNVDQPAFVNAAAVLDTDLDARALLDAMLAIERDFGRDRAADGSVRWGARTLDLDLLLYGDRVIDEPGLHVPHPHLHERAFALVPLAEIAPDLVIPGHGRVSDLVAAMVTGDIQALG
jgi:2-amino-4-hydroxy-6-hydroxymethyldihydropteridine diphosphokinase